MSTPLLTKTASNIEEMKTKPSLHCLSHVYYMAMSRMKREHFYTISSANALNRSKIDFYLTADFLPRFANSLYFFYWLSTIEQVSFFYYRKERVKRRVSFIDKTLQKYKIESLIIADRDP